ncbi:MAG: hypothetical protein DMF52_12010 [Acidobacteria bacterium]|nr:MAG: hypothetical protein DMF52_12010 [Acidobacteriota bacterium]
MPGPLRETPELARIRQEPRCGCDEGGRVLRRNQEAALAVRDRLGHATRSPRDAGDAEARGLEERQTESFQPVVLAGRSAELYEQRREGVMRGQLVRRDGAREADPRLHATLPGPHFEGRALRALADDEIDQLREPRQKLPERVDHDVVSLHRHQPRHRKEDGTFPEAVSRLQGMQPRG